MQPGGREGCVSKIAATLEETQELIEAGFEYITDIAIGQMPYKPFRKRKPWKPL